MSHQGGFTPYEGGHMPYQAAEARTRGMLAKSAAHTPFLWQEGGALGAARAHCARAHLSARWCMRGGTYMHAAHASSHTLHQAHTRRRHSASTHTAAADQLSRRAARTALPLIWHVPSPIWQAFRQRQHAWAAHCGRVHLSGFDALDDRPSTEGHSSSVILQRRARAALAETRTCPTPTAKLRCIIEANAACERDARRAAAHAGHVAAMSGMTSGAA
eukprot:6754014-Prymnesium_polylepis.1